MLYLCMKNFKKVILKNINIWQENVQHDSCATDLDFMHTTTVRKELWRVFLLLLLFLVLTQGSIIVGGFIALIHDMPKDTSKEAFIEHILCSDITRWTMVMGYVLAIAVFISKRYIRVSLGRLAHMERKTLWTAAGMAALISVGWLLTEGFLMELVHADSLFPEDTEKLNAIYGALGEGVLGFLTGGILAPIAEEIAFRGVLMRGMLKMRWHPWVAIVLSALIFAFFHGTELQMFGTTVFGIITGWLYWHTRSLLPNMFVHMVNNSLAFGVMNISECLGYDEDETHLSVKACIIILVICIPLLLYGINWYKKH